MSNLNTAVTGASTNEEARRLLLAAGVSALQRQSAYLPLETDEALPETEQSFSERTRASRQTRYIRLMKWISVLLVQWYGIGTATNNEILHQTSFVAYEKWRNNE